MNGLSWSALAIMLVVCHMTTAAPSLRAKRDDELSLDPVSVDVSRIHADNPVRDSINDQSSVDAKKVPIKASGRLL